VWKWSFGRVYGYMWYGCVNMCVCMCMCVVVCVCVCCLCCCCV
jgi:hypothetical protein